MKQPWLLVSTTHSMSRGQDHLYTSQGPVSNENAESFVQGLLRISRWQQHSIKGSMGSSTYGAVSNHTGRRPLGLDLVMGVSTGALAFR